VATRRDEGTIDEPLGERLLATRSLTLDLAAPLSDADATIQPHPDASPAKWHLAHSTWFFETFVLRDHVPGYVTHDERFAFLYNSYYEGEGERHARARRGMVSRPSLDEIRDWRRAVDAALAAALPTLAPDALALVALGVEHEQQHQELLLTDILATFAENPVEPVYGAVPPRQEAGEIGDMEWLEGREGLVDIGAVQSAFAFDCERPRHRALLHPHAIASRCVTNGEWAEFVADAGYSTPSLWSSEGWDWARREAITAPLYWRGAGEAFSLGGRRTLDSAAPVAHISYYEADDFARWAGKGIGFVIGNVHHWRNWIQSAATAEGKGFPCAAPVKRRGDRLARGPVPAFAQP